MKTQLHHSSNELTILIIEDNRGDFVLIEDYLLEKFEQIKIVFFQDYRSAIDYLKINGTSVSLLLLDLNLPDLSGIALISDILSHNFDIPIIILTGYSDLNMAKKSLQIGIYDYLVKDEINPIILHKTIVFALNRSSFINQIENEKQNYENLFNFNPQPTWLLDADSLTILNANLAAQKKYGLSLGDFRELSFIQLHPKDEIQPILDLFSSNENENAKNNFTHIAKDNNEIKVKIYFRIINTSTQSMLIVQANDISETLHHINTIEIQNARLRQIAWTQSHLVRAPISRILGIINLLENQEESPQEFMFWMEQLKISTQEMDDVVKKIVIDTNLLDNE